MWGNRSYIFPEAPMRRAVSASLIVLLLPCSAAAQQAIIVPGDNLVAQGIPPIPGSLVETVSRYTNSRAAALDDWHPTERTMLIGTRFGDTPQIHNVKFQGGARTQVTF